MLTGATRRCWQFVAAFMLFVGIGLGGLVLGFVVFPVLRLTATNADAGRRQCRYAVHLGFRLWVWGAEALGLLRCEVRGGERLGDLAGTLVVANHPSLIDVVLLIARIPNARCVVKRGVWRNPFLGSVVRAAGYVPNMGDGAVLDSVVALLQSEETVLLFPEGTRTPRGCNPVIRRGAATILLRAKRPALPVHLQMTPRALAKGDPLSSLPRCRCLSVMTVMSPVDPSMFARPDASERANASAGARLLTVLLGGHGTAP